jgi:Domain of unknown function (DUF4252)
MKKSIFLLPLFFLAALSNAAAQGDGIMRFFNQYAEDERFTVVYIAPKLFSMVSKIETDDEDWNKVREIVKDLGGLRVLHADSIADGLTMYKDALKRVPTTEYSELLTVRDGDENVRIWTKDTNDGTVIEELLLLVGSTDAFTLLSFTGKINLDKISDLSKALDVDGVKHLDKVKSKSKN